MIVFAVVFAALLLVAPWRRSGSVRPGDLLWCAGYVALMAVLQFLVSPSFRSNWFTASSSAGLIAIYLWHGHETRAGRGEPVGFGKR